ncbi:hypothetical protein BDA96_03G139500 [Sorghum bicolor]|uniref:Uncharacterized protein n=1 Tax=Sorghum bicolor TaxID=4558 RepID=A0A921UMN0_SORBI|nr:hypothetical protein BDA96_03G139500 [Sorghum bicolor]
MSARIFDMDEETVRQRFAEECRGRLIITEVRRCFHRLHAMDPFCEPMQVQRPVFGWYGAKAQLVEHGAFQDEALHMNWERVEILSFERAHGGGVHIAPVRRIMKSAMLSMVGSFHQECHMLLCALALGIREIVPEGSEQDSPSNPLFQTGVANELGEPMWHLIWETSEPGGVLPLYVVSFVFGH